MLRTAISLSAVTGVPCHISHIRAGRPKPGLAAQHLAGIVAAAELCGAHLEGARIGAQEVWFQPGEIRGGRHGIAVGTAGSVTLVLQTLVPIALRAGEATTLQIEGGTDVAWSPLIDYFIHVHCGYLRDMGAEVTVEILRRGFYPRGGGRVVVRLQPWATPARPIEVIEWGHHRSVNVWSVASEDLRRARVAERQLEGFMSVWPSEYRIGSINQLYVDSPSPGTSVHSHAECQGSRLGSCAVGRRGRRAEVVGREAAELLLEELASGAPVDRWMADQLIPYLGICGGAIRASRITEHTRTNIWVTEQFLPRRFTLEGSTIRAA